MTSPASELKGSPHIYHVRQLERFGLVERVEPAPGERVDGRTRRGTATPRNDPPEMRAARQALVASAVARQYLDRVDELPAAWQDAAAHSTYGLLASPGELRDVIARIDAILRPPRTPGREDAPADRVVRTVVESFARVDPDGADRRERR